MSLEKSILLSIGAITTTTLYASHVEDSVKPNIVFFLIEDTSSEFLQLYNQQGGVKLANVDKLRKDGVLFTNVYSNAPVSSAARTSLITGCFAPRLAGSFHRHIEKVPMPDGYKMFPSYLRDAGYYTSNANKTDYNLSLDKGAWDDVNGGAEGWRKRQDKSQPFFYMYTTTITHESKLLFNQEVKDRVTPNTSLDSIFLMPYHPDTELMRYTYATFYDKIKEADVIFGDMVDKLESDGVLDNTIIFFFGDNGGCVPGTKGYTDNIGLHVPLFVYIPPALQDRYNLPIGGEDNRSVSFIDFGTTALSIAGVEPPKSIDGAPFMGSYDSGDENRSVVCYGDRYDDLYSFNRVLYRGDFRYARNYQPYHTQGLYAYYRYKSLAFQQWREMFYRGELNSDQSNFFMPFGAEELYDLKNDPYELNNLADDPKYRKKLVAMRDELHDYLIEKHDLGFIPEFITIEKGYDNIVKYGEQYSKDIERYLSIADLQMKEYPKVKKKLKQHLNSVDNIDKWWSLTTLSTFTDESNEFIEEVKELLKEGQPSYLRSRAMVYLSLMGVKLYSDNIIDVIERSSSLAEVLLVQNDLAFIKELGNLPLTNFTNEQLPYTSQSAEERVLYLNSIY